MGLVHISDGKLPSPLQKIAQRLQRIRWQTPCSVSPRFHIILIQVGSTAIAAGVTCAMATKDDYEWARDNVILDLCLQTKMIAIADFLNSVKRLNACLETYPELMRVCPAATQIHQFMQNAPAE